MPEWVVQKLTEAGVDRIVVLESRRVRRALGEASAGARAIERLRPGGARSRRPEPPPLAPRGRGRGRARRLSAQPGSLSPWPWPSSVGPPRASRAPAVAVGPEGGWDPPRPRGRPLGGPRAQVLRAETAAVAAGLLLCALRQGVVGPAPGPERIPPGTNHAHRLPNEGSEAGSGRLGAERTGPEKVLSWGPDRHPSGEPVLAITTLSEGDWKGLSAHVPDGGDQARLSSSRGVRTGAVGRYGDERSEDLDRHGEWIVMVNTVLPEEDEQEESARAAYARAVGSRLRAVRKQMRLSLQAVEAMSDQEFKASVLGAYERGERAISVPRLQRLAKLYDVPVDQLLPQDDDATRWGPNGEGNGNGGLRARPGPGASSGPGTATTRSRST